jgi:uncharacterized protein DUF4214
MFLPVAMSDQKNRRRSMSLFGLFITIFLVILAPSPASALMPAMPVTRFSVGLDDGSVVTVDTISHYPLATVATMVITADRSTQTGCPFSERKKGLISAGDRVFVSDYYIAWFDYTVADGVPTPVGWSASTFARSGSLAGLWTLNPSSAGPTGVYFKNVAGFTNATYGICFNWPRNELEPGSYSPTGEMNWWDKYSPPNENAIGVAYSGSVVGPNGSSGIHLMSVNSGQASSASGFTQIEDGIQDSSMAVHYEIEEYMVDEVYGVITFASSTGNTAYLLTNFSYVANQAGITALWNFYPVGGNASVTNLYSALWQSYTYLQDASPYSADSTTCGNGAPQPVLYTLPVATNEPVSRQNPANNPLPYDLSGSSSFASAQENTYQTALSNLGIYSGSIYQTCNGIQDTGPYLCPHGLPASFDWNAVETSVPTPTEATPTPCTGSLNLDIQVFDYVPNTVPALPLPGFSPPFNTSTWVNTSRSIQAGDRLSVSQPNGTGWVITDLQMPFTGTAATGIGFPFDRITLSYDHSDLDTSTNLIRGPYNSNSDSSQWFTLQAGTMYSVAYSITQGNSTVVMPMQSTPILSTTPIVTEGISRNCDMASIAQAYPPTATYQLEYIYCLMLERLPDTGISDTGVKSGSVTYTPLMENGQITWQQMMDITFNSAEFNNDFSLSSLTNTQFVSGLYYLLLSRAPNSNDPVASYVTELNSGSLTRQQLFDMFTSGTEFLKDSPVLSGIY